MTAALSILILSSLIASQGLTFFFNLKHVQNICPAQLPIKVGTMSAMENADFGDTEVYVNKDGIANVLSLFCLGQKYRMTYDSHDRNGVFMVHTPRGIVEFHPTTNGLHIVDLKQNPEVAYLLVNDADITDNIPWADSPPVHQVQVNTVHQNFEGYTKNKFNKLSVPAASWAW
jgi:hypothetical protein